MAIDHQAFIDILYQGEGTVGGTMLPAPDGRPHASARRLRLGGFWPEMVREPREKIIAVNLGPT